MRRGTPENVVPAVARDAGATQRAHQRRLRALRRRARRAGRRGAGRGPAGPHRFAYAVAPGRVVKSDGQPFRVFTPFYRAWSAHGWRGTGRLDPARISWLAGHQRRPAMPARSRAAGAPRPARGRRRPRTRRWARFRRRGLDDYADERDRPDLDGTSRMSVHLKCGEIHPRTLLADLGDPDRRRFRRELAWREFYADVLFHLAGQRPRLPASRVHGADAVRHRRDADAQFEAWTRRADRLPDRRRRHAPAAREGWMHNRVRMIVASASWSRICTSSGPHGARHFMRHLVDGDLASNQHGWQWTAGTGTDAAPYFRVFNPIRQGQKFDPDGGYVRRYVPELRGLSGAAAHEPWEHPDGVPADYVERIVDHASGARPIARQLPASCGPPIEWTCHRPLTLPRREPKASGRVARGNLHPRAPTERSVTVSRHSALLTALRQYARTHAQWANRSGSRSVTPGPPRLEPLEGPQPLVLLRGPAPQVGVDALQEGIQLRPVELAVVVHPPRTMGFSHSARSSRSILVRRWIRQPRTCLTLGLERLGLIAGKNDVNIVPLPALGLPWPEGVPEERERRVLVRTSPPVLSLQ